MDILAKSFLVLTREWNGILGILGILLLGSGIVILWLSAATDDKLDFGEYLTLGIGGGLLALFLGISLTVLFDFLFRVKINFIVFCLVILVISSFASYWLKRGGTPKTDSKISPSLQEQSKTDRFKERISIMVSMLFKAAPVLVLFLFLIISIYIRLAFISGLIVPLYFDSPMHYSIVTDLISNFEASTLPAYSSFVGGYYHLGFHVLVAALSLSLPMDVKAIILIFGQIILAIIPFPLFFIVKQETKLDTPAIFATILAGWGWSLPAHAVNWGKYPALTSILAFEFVLCCIYLVSQSAKNRRWFLICLLGLSIFVSTFIHTRSLVLIIIAIISSLIALAWYKFPRSVRFITFCLAISGLAVLIYIARTKPILNIALEPYQTGGLWITLLVLSLSPFALREFPRATFSVILSFLFLFSSLFISVSQFLPAYDVQTLLDRPYVEMIVFFPLAFLGGLGFAGMSRTLHKIDILNGTRQKWIYGLVALSLFGAIFMNSSRYSFLPSACCNFFGGEDAIALDWIDKNISPNANILIASSEAVVFENTPSVQYAGSDSGIWITPLIHRNSTSLPYQTDFSLEDTVNKLCKSGITHIYVGGLGTNFNNGQIKTLSAWYESVLHLPKTQVYKLVGCP